MKKWGQIRFDFKSDKTAYRMARWISFGKEFGVIPDTIEIQYDGKYVILGHWAANGKTESGKASKTKS